MKFTCKKCNESFEIKVSKSQIAKWQAGALIQDAMPHLSVDDREFVRIRVCTNCWEKMMGVKLTLTKSERDAIDWIGGRYEHGHELSMLLLDSFRTDEDSEWDEPMDITFIVGPKQWPAYIELLKDCQYDCFAGELKAKLSKFIQLLRDM